MECLQPKMQNDFFKTICLLQDTNMMSWFNDYSYFKKYDYQVAVPQDHLTLLQTMWGTHFSVSCPVLPHRFQGHRAKSNTRGNIVLSSLNLKSVWMCMCSELNSSVCIVIICSQKVLPWPSTRRTALTALCMVQVRKYLWEQCDECSVRN